MADDLADLRRWYPKVPIWHGNATGSWWALLPGQLVEASDAAMLARHLGGILARSDGRWSATWWESRNPADVTTSQGRDAGRSARM